MIRSLMNRAIGRINSWKEFTLEDISESDNGILQSIKPYTMTSPERVYAILEAVRYVIKSNLPGSIVECGVWRGGNMMAVAKLLREHEVFDKDLYLFDTFEGMPPPTDIDVDFRGRTAQRMFASKRVSEHASNWCYASLTEVQSNLGAIHYPENKIHFVAGKVEDTIPQYSPENISILRLDTDWYESTKHELIHLYPRLIKGGVLIIDDYGHWHGARRAVDEFLEENKLSILLNRIDYSGRIAIKV